MSKTSKDRLARFRPASQGRLLILLLFICAAGVRPAGAAQEEDLVVRAALVDYQFGQVMNFSLTAESAAPIVAATLFIQVPELPSTLTIDEPLAPATTISLTRTVDLNLVRFAPFTVVTYWWLVEDDAGRSVESAEQTLAYDDDRFEWRAAASDQAIVFWSGDDVTVGQVGLDIVAAAWPRLEAVMPVSVTTPVRIYVYPTAADLRAALRLTGRDWVSAHARPELGVILVTAGNPSTAAVDLSQSIPHELSHLFLAEAGGIAYAEMPRWFDEGLASVLEDTPNPNYDLVLQEALMEGSTIPFAELCLRFPDDGQQAWLAYAQSASLVRHIQVNYGNQAIGRLIQAYGDGADCHSGIRRELDLSLGELNQEWLARQLPRSTAVQLWERVGLWLLLILVGFALTGFFLLNPLEKQTR